MASAQDPATGWMAYAVGSVDKLNAERITRLEMQVFFWWPLQPSVSTSTHLIACARAHTHAPQVDRRRVT